MKFHNRIAKLLAIFRKMWTLLFKNVLFNSKASLMFFYYNVGIEKVLNMIKRHSNNTAPHPMLKTQVMHSSNVFYCRSKITLKIESNILLFTYICLQIKHEPTFACSFTDKYMKAVATVAAVG